MSELRPRTRSQAKSNPGSPATTPASPAPPPRSARKAAPRTSEKKKEKATPTPTKAKKSSAKKSPAAVSKHKVDREEEDDEEEREEEEEEEEERKSSKKGEEKFAEGTNWVSGGVEENAALFSLVCVAPFLTVLLGYLTSPEFTATTGLPPHLSAMLPACWSDLEACSRGLLATTMMLPDPAAVKFIAGFMAVGALLELLPGSTEVGPETLTGHIPVYKDNGVRHCLVFTFLFFAGSNLGWGDYYDFGVMYDVFPGSIAFLNIFGIVFCLFLTWKGLTFPSTADCGSSGSAVKDFLWGTELYPRLLGWDLKRFINCRFSMTYWQLAGLSFAYRSFTLHGAVDYGLLLAAVSQYLYLFKFFWWEMGYMRSIDIIVDRAGFEIQWGCLVWVPAVYTLHSRFCVLQPSQLSLPAASALFVMSMLGVSDRLDYTILDYTTILYYTILYYTILYYTILDFACLSQHT
jgi:hypothetical protein